MFRPEVVLQSLFLRSYDPTIYVHETALSIASEESANVSLSECFQAPRQHKLSKDVNEAPHALLSPRERNNFLLTVARPEPLTASIFPTIQMPETVYGSDAAELT